MLASGETGYLGSIKLVTRILCFNIAGYIYSWLKKWQRTVFASESTVVRFTSTPLNQSKSKWKPGNDLHGVSLNQGAATVWVNN